MGSTCKKGVVKLVVVQMGDVQNQSCWGVMKRGLYRRGVVQNRCCTKGGCTKVGCTKGVCTNGKLWKYGVSLTD